MWLSMALALTAGATCHVDRAAELRLDEQHFDQDLEGGWRALDNRGCKREAADLIRSYRLAKHRSDERLLFWHEGQVRAMLGETSRAIDLFNRSKAPASEAGFGWNLYVDGTIAFLRNDRATLLGARRALAALPPPPTPLTLTINGQSVRVPWPPNLNVLDSFLKCFGQPYSKAYGCAEPMLKLPAAPPKTTTPVADPRAGDRS